MIIVLLATLVISLTACVVDIQETESGDLQELINSIKIEDDQDVYYDRSEWTSSSQLYLCNNHRHDHNRNSYTGDDDGKFTSIRAYAYEPLPLHPHCHPARDDPRRQNRHQTLHQFIKHFRTLFQPFVVIKNAPKSPSAKKPKTRGQHSKAR